MKKIKTVKIKEIDGSIGEESYAITADAKDVDMSNGRDVQETIGTINIDKDGNIATQLKNKISKNNIVDNLESSDPNKVLSANQGKILGDKISEKPYYFNNIEDMKKANLKAGDMAITLGYYESNDGGKAEYIIRQSVSTDIDDDAFTIFLSNGLIGALIIKDDIVNVKTIGAKTQQYSTKKEESFYDNKNIITKTIAYLNSVNATQYKGSLTLYFPIGYYGFSETHIYRRAGLKFKGEPNFPRVDTSNKNYTNGVVIVPLNNNQEYIWKIGGAPEVDSTAYADENRFMINSDIDGLTFSTVGYDNVYKWARYGLLLDGVLYSHYGKLYFYNFRGCPIGIRSSWEDYFDILNFRRVADVTTPCLHFLPVSGILSSANNISGCYFNYMMFENCGGDLIYADTNSNYIHNEIGTINIEDGFATMPGQSASTYNSQEDLSNAHHCAVIKGAMLKSVINAINYNETAHPNWPAIIIDETGEKYIRDSIFCIENSEKTQYIINTLNISTYNKEIAILRAMSSYNERQDSFIAGQINYLMEDSANYTNYDVWFEVNRFPYIKVGNFCKNSHIGSRAHEKAIPAGYIDLTEMPYISGASNGGRLYGDHGYVPFSKANIYLKKRTDNNSCISAFRWPYPYDATKEYKIIFYVKGNENEPLGVQLGSSNSNATFCSVSITSATGGWQALRTKINATQNLDLNTWVYVNSKGYAAETVGIVGISVIELDKENSEGSV